MNKLKNARGSIDFYLFLLLILSIPFHFRVTSAIFILWIVSWLVQKTIIEKNKHWFKFNNNRTRLLFFLSLFYFILLTASLLWSSNINIGIHTLETKLAMLFVPIVLINVNDNYSQNKQWVYKFFLGGLIISTLICFIAAFINSFGSSGFSLGNNFYYTTFSKFLHPSYFAMFITLGILLLKLNLVGFKKHEATVSYILIIFLLVILFFLSSKAGIFITYFILFIDVAINIIKKKTYKKSFIELVLLGVLFLCTVNFNARKPVSSVTSKTNFETSETNQPKHTSSTASRVVIWKSALQVYKKNILLGVGIGDLKPELFKEFEKSNFQAGIERNYNTHNQYLEDGLNAGILTNITLLLLFLIPLLINLKEGNYLTIYFILVLAMNFLFESMLEKQNGVMFFAIFYSYFIFAQKKS